ncbi:hypothetical protein LNI91_12020 [Tenacibaculum dicentrarchi]|nr:hypothetical protein [Tenacibaculum dicentrarchi]
MKTFFSRLILIVTAFIIGSHTFNTFKRVKNKKYLKEEIEFSEKGIQFRHSKKSISNELIELDKLNKLSLIVDFTNFKFFLNSSDTPILDFNIFTLKEKFISEISNILKLEIIDSADFDRRKIYKLESIGKKIKKTKVSSKLVSEVTKESDSKKEILDFKYFSIKPSKDLILIQSKRFDFPLEFSKSLYISIKERIIWHRRFFILKEVFKFSEINSFEKEVKENPDTRAGITQIIGNLYLKRIDKKRRKIFTIRKVVDKQRELIEYEILKSLEQVEYEILKNKKYDT